MTVKNLSLVINKVLNSEKLKNELETLENREQIYDFFTQNGYYGSYDEFCVEMNELFNLLEISDDDLDSVVGGLRVNSGKVAATALSVLSLLSSMPSINAVNTQSNKNTSISSSQKFEKTSEISFDDSFLNSFFSNSNKSFWNSLKSKFFEKTSKSSFVRIDNLILKFKNYYKSNKNALNVQAVSGMLFSIIKIAEEKNSGSKATQQNAAEAKSALEKIANKLKNKNKVNPEETLHLIEKVDKLYKSTKGEKTKRFKSIEEVKTAIEKLIDLESLKTYKSSASKSEIAEIKEIISAISDYYVDVGALNGKTFKSYIEESKDYKELLKNEKSVSIKNIIKTIKTVCKSDIEVNNGTIKAVGKENDTSFVSGDKICRKINIDEDLTKSLIQKLNTACDYSNHVYMFEKSDMYEYDSHNGKYTKLEKTNEDEANKSNQTSKINEGSPYFGYFGDNFAGLVDIIPQGEDEGTVYLAFRGTYSKDDAWIDSDVSKSECYFLGKKCVHRGFLNRYLQLQSEMKRLLDDKIGCYRRETGKEIKKIVVTGHSLGGALATLAALELKQNDKKMPVKLITFCSPRVLSFEAYDYVTKNNILPQSGENGAVRIYRHGDVVPNMPSSSMGFKHFGEVFFIANPPNGFESDSEKTIYSKIKSYFSLDDWKEWVKSFIGYHSITGILEDVSRLGKEEKVIYKELF